MGKCAEAVANVEKEVHKEFVGNLNRFYSEYSPEEYIRTGALFDSLEVTGIKQVGNSTVAEVYFITPSWEHGWVPLQSGNYGYSYWSDEKIMNVAMKGTYPHGGYERGTAIWDSSMRSLGGQTGIKNLLKQELKRQGL
jgi:hypothetical protein